MGTEVFLAISGGTSYWRALGPGIFFLFCGIIAVIVVATDSDYGRPGKFSIGFCIVGLLLCAIITPFIYANYSKPELKANEKAALNQLESIQEAYQQPFYLKEMVSEIGVQGEVKGNVSGLLFVAGNIYGKIESGRVISVVYKDEDPWIDHYIGVHRSISLPLDEVVIVTISAGEIPHIKYPEVKIFKERGTKTTEGLRLVPGTPHLYLPEGWKIL